MQAVPFITRVESLNTVDGEVYSIQHCVIKFVSVLQQVCGFLRVFWFPPTIKLTATIYNRNIVESGFKHLIDYNPNPNRL